MVQSDVLSQRLDLVQDEDNNNDDIVMLPDKLFINSIDTELKDMLEKAMPEDKFNQMTLESLIERGMPPIKLRHTTKTPGQKNPRSTTPWPPRTMEYLRSNPKGLLVAWDDEVY
uniref:Reverse transcriptase-rnase h-integrase n=1 Tax=Moniliophthora roreri TaxID=221103 RepID=A0A0W0G236_MONRR